MKQLENHWPPATPSIPSTNPQGSIGHPKACIPMFKACNVPGGTPVAALGRGSSPLKEGWHQNRIYKGSC